MDFYLLEQDLRLPGICAIGEEPEGLDPLEWRRGRPATPPAGVVQLKLSANSGDEHCDLIGSLLTVFHDDLKRAFDDFGVTNVEYFAAELEHPLTRKRRANCWLVNVLGIAECVDRARSDVQPYPSGAGVRLGSFHIDEARAPTLPIFRLGEEPGLIVITKALREYLRSQDLGAVRLRHTKSYDGY